MKVAAVGCAVTVTLWLAESPRRLVATAVMMLSPATNGILTATKLVPSVNAVMPLTTTPVLQSPWKVPRTVT
jgi:hypothetical protein